MALQWRHLLVLHERLLLLVLLLLQLDLRWVVEQRVLVNGGDVNGDRERLLLDNRAARRLKTLRHLLPNGVQHGLWQ